MSEILSVHKFNKVLQFTDNKANTLTFFNYPDPDS